MAVTGHAAAGGGRRACSGCGSPLSRYNPGSVCQSCLRAGGDTPTVNPQDMSVRGARIAELRRKRGLTQKVLADRAGVSFSIVEKLERNTRKSAKLRTLSAIAGVLRVPIDDLLDPEGTMIGGPESLARNGISGAGEARFGTGENTGGVPARRVRSAADVLRTRIYTERKARGWPARKIAEVLRSLADKPDSLPSVYILIRMIRGWESGRHVPGELYRLLYCKAFAMTEDELFGDSCDPPNSPVADAGICRIPVDVARWDGAEITLSAPARMEAVSLVISLSLPYVPDRLVINISQSSTGDRDVNDIADFPEATAGHLTLLHRAPAVLTAT
jgi:transcriptional regulator with XRE-family HTH domain